MYRVLVPALLAAAVACADAPEAVAPEDSRAVEISSASVATFATYLAPITVTRAGSGPQVDTIDLSGLPRDRFMAPFRLRVLEHAGSDVLGTIALDGTTVLRLGGLVPGDSATRIVDVGAASMLVITLKGAPGGAVTLRIEGTVLAPPAIDIRRPRRAAMILRGGNGARPIDVQGEVCDASFAIVELSVNGVAQPVSGTELCESFATTVESPWGVTTFAVEATNAAGRTARRVQSFLRSRFYSMPELAIAEDPAYDSMVDVGWAAAVRYEQAGFQKLMSVMPASLDAGPGLGSSFTSNVEIGSCGEMEWSIDRDSVSSNIDQVQSTVTSDHVLRLTVQFDVRVSFTADYCGVNGFLHADGPGTLTANNVLLYADIGFGIEAVPGRVQVELEQINDLDFSSAVLALSASFNSVPGFHKEYLRSTLIEELTNAASQDVQTSIDSTGIALAFERLILPTDGLADVGVDMTSAASVMELRNNGADVGLRAQTAPLVARGGTAPQRGSIRTRSMPSLLPAANDVNEYLGDDFVNQVLWSAWQAGWFDALDLETLSDPIDGLSAELYSLLPPVLMPAGGRVRIGWGDAELTALVDRAQFGLGDATGGDAVEVTAYGNVWVDARVRYDSIAHRLVLRSASAQADVELTSPGGSVLDEVALRDALAGALEQAALARLAAVIEATPLPEADLSGMLGAPPGTTLDLHDPNTGRAGRFQRVGGIFGALNY